MTNTDIAYLGYVFCSAWIFYLTLCIVLKDSLWVLKPLRWLYRGWRLD